MQLGRCYYLLIPGVEKIQLRNFVITLVSRSSCTSSSCGYALTTSTTFKWQTDIKWWSRRTATPCRLANIFNTLIPEGHSLNKSALLLPNADGVGATGSERTGYRGPRLTVQSVQIRSLARYRLSPHHSPLLDHACEGRSVLESTRGCLKFHNVGTDSLDHISVD